MQHVDDRAEQGFSLIEVLIVASLIVGAVTGVAQVFVIAARTVNDARHATYATVLAARKMEELRAAPLSAVAESVDYADASGVLVIEGAGSSRAIYERRWSAEALQGSPDLLAVTVTVVHRHSAPPAGRVRLVTLRAARRSVAEVADGAPDE